MSSRATAKEDQIGLTLLDLSGGYEESQKQLVDHETEVRLEREGSRVGVLQTKRRRG